MSSATAAVSVEHLGKRYHIGVARQHQDTAREAVTAHVRSAVHRLRHFRSAAEQQGQDTIWALTDVSFEVARGEVTGLIGRNGAGKSTLLKILGRITEPTTGRATLWGRVGSLLDVGTGFHPELTGRENIYLSGALLGMRRTEIARKFDEIVTFAEIDKFLDTPVKRYSSGMYVRLAFAVAAHLEPEILLVDEVLAVGDAAFQRRCLGKIRDVTTEGRTVLFVSHNMVAVRSLCERVLWLDAGAICDRGPAADVVSNYLKSVSSGSILTERCWEDPTKAPGTDAVRLHRICVRPAYEGPFEQITMGDALELEVAYWNLVTDARLHMTLHVYTEEGAVAFTTGSAVDGAWRNRPLPRGLFRSVCRVPANLLNSGVHRVLLLVVKDLSSVIFRQEDAISFDVVDMRPREGAWYGKEPGVVQPVLEWRTEQLCDSLPGDPAWSDQAGSAGVASASDR